MRVGRVHCLLTLDLELPFLVHTIASLLHINCNDSGLVLVGVLQGGCDPVHCTFLPGDWPHLVCLGLMLGGTELEAERLKSFLL